jgi:hypothetical protein
MTPIDPHPLPDLFPPAQGEAGFRMRYGSRLNPLWDAEKTVQEARSL